jgi:hypothetical protein
VQIDPSGRSSKVTRRAEERRPSLSIMMEQRGSNQEEEDDNYSFDHLGGYDKPLGRTFFKS